MVFGDVILNFFSELFNLREKFMMICLKKKDCEVLYLN
jgi:hypothetical protein